MRRLLFALAIVHVLPGQAAAQGAGAAQPRELRIDYIEDSLPNGLRVLYHVDNTSPVAAVVLWYDVGSKHEQPGRTGFAHLFEHMMFKGSRNVGDGEHFALLEQAGGRAGQDINGTTSNDRTNYFQQVPSNQLELALWMEADRMATLLEAVDSAKLENQREVVKNERRQGVDNQPYGTAWENMTERVFPEGHPYHHPVIGSMEDLSAATLENVHAFFRTYYAPNNAVVVIAGDIDVARTREMVRRHFGWIPRGPDKPPLRDMSLPPVIGTEQRLIVRDSLAPAPAVFVGYRMPAAREPRGPATTLLAHAMGSGRSSRLYESLVREQQIATSVFAFNFGLVDGADLVLFGAYGRPTTNPDSLEQALIRELDRAMQGFTEPELTRAKIRERFDDINALQVLGGFGGRADRLAEAVTFYDDPNKVNTRLAELDAVTAAQLSALARERLVPGNRVRLVYIPAKMGVTP